MTTRIKGPKGGPFEGCEFVECGLVDGCKHCDCKTGGDVCNNAAGCCVVVLDEDGVFGNWKRVKPAVPVTPTAPGWYWVRGLATPTRPVYINEHHIKMQMFMDHAFVDCQFAPCPMPEGWET